MSHRERVAWLSLGTIAVTFVPYLIVMRVSPPAAPLPDVRALGLFGAAAVGQMLLLGLGILWLRRRSPEEAGAPADERDRAISLRALGIAYHVLLAGTIVVGCVMPFTTSGWALINGAIAVIVLAQVVQYGVAVWCYRRGWHG